MPATGFQRTLSTLARTPNHSAADVLMSGMEGPSPSVRNGSIAAFARRKGEASQRKFLEAFHRLTAEEINALGDSARNVRTTLRKMLAEHDGDAARDACHFIVVCRAFDEFPALVAAASDPSHPGGDAMASTTLELALALHDQIVAYRRAPSGRDPSFARRWALTALAKAVEQFRDHRRVELLEAFLLITTSGNHTLSQLLTDTSHPGHEPLLILLRTSPSIGAIEVLAKLFDDTQTPLPLLELAVQRTDPHFRGLFLEAIGYPASARVLGNIQRTKKPQLLEKPTTDWFQMTATQQAVAIQMAVASRFSRRTKLAIIDAYLKQAAPLARLAACELLGGIEIPEASTRLERLLSDSDPQVVALAAKALRRHGYTGAVQRLAVLLDHEDGDVRKVAQSGLRDFTFLRYVGQFDTLDANSRVELGHIVRESDPSAIDQLSRELSAATLPRKLRGLQMAAAMAAVDEIVELVIKQATHQDAAVRAEALSTLANSSDKRARFAMEAASADANALVRNRASQALRDFTSNNAKHSGGNR